MEWILKKLASYGFEWAIKKLIKDEPMQADDNYLTKDV